MSLSSANPLRGLECVFVGARQETVMQDCPKSEQLLQWLNGLIDESIGNDLSSHVAGCSDCQAQLERLTDSSTLKPSDGGGALDGPMFTNEPHFQSLRKSLPQKISQLRSEDSHRNDGLNDGANGLRNAMVDVADAPQVATVNASHEATPAIEPHFAPPMQDAIDESLQQSFADEGYLLEGLIGLSLIHI